MTQRLAAGATHGRCEGDGALQWAVLLTAASTSEDCGTEPGPSYWGRRTGEAAVHSKLQPFQPTGTLEASNCLEMFEKEKLTSNVSLEKQNNAIQYHRKNPKQTATDNGCKGFWSSLN